MENQRDLLIENSDWFEINQRYQNIINKYSEDNDIVSIIGFLSDKTEEFTESVFDNKNIRSRDLDILSVVADFLEETKEEMRSVYIAQQQNIYEDMDNYLSDNLEFKIGVVVHVLSTAEALYQVAERREEGLLMYISEQWINDRRCNS